MNEDRIAIIGGGWYGCHIAATLLALGFKVTLYEKSDRLMNAASGNNQFRLHMGFHYARHQGTRLQSRDGFMRFVERYLPLTRSVENNIYAVARDESLVDYPTYKLIMSASGLSFTEIEAPDFLKNTEGVIITRERVLLLNDVRNYFTRILGSSLELRYEVKEIISKGQKEIIDGEAFDYVIDCTWGHFNRPSLPIYYEPTILLYYEGDSRAPAVTLVDGPLCSVYPTEDPNIFTLSSVTHTPLGQLEDPGAARREINAADGVLVNRKRLLMEEQMSRYIPSFADNFRFLGPQFSIKTKLLGSFDDRSCYVQHNDRRISVMSGKIDTVFFAMERILAILEFAHSPELGAATTSLRSDINRTVSRRSENA